MATVVADTSALVSLAGARSTGVLALVVESDDLVVPRAVVEELDETASYGDEQADAAGRALTAASEEAAVREVEPDPGFPLDAGENAAVTLANELGADLFLCDEFDDIGLIHASLADVRLVTTPKLLEVLVHRGSLTRDEALDALDEIAELRSWAGNSYVERARDLLRDG